MCFDSANQLPARDFPELHRAIPAAADQEATVRQKGEAPDPIVKGLRPSLLLRDPKAPALDAPFKRVGFMPFQPADLLPTGEHFKQRNASDVVSTGQKPAVLRKGCDDVPMLVVDIPREQRE